MYSDRLVGYLPAVALVVAPMLAEEGTKPADLPIEQPMRYDFVINRPPRRSA